MIRRRSKYRNVRTVVDGLTFDSKREAGRWVELKLLERAGLIADLERQVRFTLLGPEGKPLIYRSKRVLSYVADFTYTDVASGRDVIEDSKGARDRAYLIKRAIMDAMGHRILET